jgi:glycosyltransferase involved in cell wall biosynthesis
VARKLAYLSGAVRVSTDPNAEAAGPRSHILGVLHGFQRLGRETDRFIVGDLLPARFSREGSERLIRGGGARTYLADIVRLALRPVLPALARRAIGAQVDWAYERFSTMQALGAAFQRRGVPWILETNGILYAESSGDRKTLALKKTARAMEVHAYRQCDALVCTTQALADLVVEVAGIDSAKIVISRAGVEPERFAASEVPVRRLFEGPILGYAGGLNPWQGLQLPIEAIAELRREGIPYDLVIVGDGPMRQPWQILADSLGEREHVRFVGHVPAAEVAAYIRGFDLAYSGHAAPTIGRMYYSPVKLYEYMAAGRPAVTSAHAEAVETLEPGRLGYLFQAGDKEDLKRALRTAYEHQAEWAAIGARAQAEVARKHSWVHRVEALESDLEAVLEGRFGTPYPARRQR